MLRRARVVLLVAALSAGCASAPISFSNAAPAAPVTVPAWEYRPEGAGPFPAVVLFHGCHGVSASNHEWARWFRDQGYVALVVDSWGARGIGHGCDADTPDVPNTERFDDAMGALRFLQSRRYVDKVRVGAIGWSNGGVFAIAVVNGPSLERARGRGVALPEPGFAAAVAFYPGGCYSLVSELVARPLLVLLGDADDWTIPGPCVEMVDRMRQRGADATIVLYPGAYHYFDVPDQKLAYLPEVGNRNKPGECCGATVGFDASAFADARRRVATFFARHLKPR
jgi:dienelactone hydrolase